MKNKIITTLFVTILLFLINVKITHAFVGSTNPNPVPDDGQSTEIDLFSAEAEHQIPLQVPPGTNGLTPKLALQYQSGRSFGNGGLFGFGWAIESPFIFRDTNHTPGDTSDDYYRLAWNGTSYKLIDQGSGKYKTNIETFLNIIHQSSGASNATGDYWTIQTKDGTTYRFGYNSASEVACSNRSFTLGWALDDVTDTHGNNIYYNYTQNPNGNDIGTIYPTNIQYNNDTSRQIQFNYSTSDSPVMKQGYYGGCLVRYARNLSSITTSANSSQVRKYNLSYSNTTSRNFLNSVTEVGSNNSSSLPSTSFTYNGEPSSWNTSSQTWVNHSSGLNAADLSNTQVRLIDVNGDGLPDIVKSQNNGGAYETYQVWLNTGSSWNTTPQTWVNNGNLDGADLSFSGVELIDVNGDGLPDIVKSKNNGGAYETYEVYLNTGSGWSTTQQVWVNNAAIDDADLGNTDVRLIDVNGDGLPDIVKSNNQGGPNETYEVYLNTGSSWSTSAQIWVNNASIDAADLSNSQVRLIDVNGDGLPDIVKSDNQGGPMETYYVYLNNGSSWNTTAQTWVNDANLNAADLTNTQVTLADVNGDGLPDIIKSQNNGGAYETYQVWLNTGSSWSTSPQTWINNASIDDADLTNASVQIVDVNGDGLPDIVKSDNGGGPIESYSVWTNLGHASDLLSNIQTEKGGTISYSYASSIGTSGTTMPFNEWVVSQMTKDNGLTNSQHTSDTTTYTYKNGVYNTANKEFRGFGEVDETDPNSAKKQTFFKQDDGLKGTMYDQKITDSSGNPYTETADTWNSSLSGSVYTNTLTSENKYTYDGSSSGPKTTETDYTYDSYGNVTKESDLGDTSTSSDDRFKYKQYTYNTSSYIVDLPYDTYINKSDDSTKVSETWDYYDGNTSLTTSPTKGDLTKEVKWLSGGTNPTTTYTYDSYGNKTGETDANSHSTSWSYGTNDTTHTYPDSTTNAKSQTTSMTYDLGTGNMLTKTDPNGFTTTFTYDVFGRVSKEIDPYDSSSYPTKVYTYYDNSSAPQGSLTSQREVSSQSATLDTYTFTDGLGRTIQTRKPAEDTSKQIVVDTFYDPTGKMLKESVPHLDTLSTTYVTPLTGIEYTSYTYDPIARVTQVTNPQGTYKTTSYDHWAQTDTDENGHAKKKVMDAFNNIVEVDEYNNGSTYTTTYAYDFLNDLTGITDVNSNNFSFTYDTLKRKTAMTDPDMGTWDYTYDGIGNLLTTTDNRGRTTTNTYDALNRIASVSYPTDPSITYTYDGNSKIGTLTSVTDAAGTVAYQYDNRLRKTQEQRVTDGITWTKNYAYDAANRIITTTMPDSEIVSNTYDAQGELASVSGVLNFIDYNAFDKVTDKTFNNGLTTDYTYGSSDFRLNRIQTGSAQDVSYTYDNVGNTKTITDNLLSKTQTFGYDNLDRLTTASESAGYNYTYAYNPIGDLTSFTSPDTTTTYTYGSSTLVHAPATLTSTTMIYDDSLAYGWTDASFNTTNSSETTNVYSGSNALSSTIGASGGLDFQAPRFFTTGAYSYVHFALKASASGQQYKVYADSTFGQALATPVSLASYGGQPTTSGWTVYNIPLSDLGASNVTLGDLVLYNATGSSEPAVYVDQVELMPGTAPTPIPTATPTPGAPTATPTPTPATPQMVQGTDGTATTGNTATVPFSSNITAGNMILAVISHHSGSVTSVTDSQGDTFTAVSTPQHANSSTDYTEMYYAKNVHGGATSVTANFSTTTKLVLGIYEYSGLDQTSPLDQVTTNTGNSSSPNGGTLTTTIDNELYFVVGVDDYTGNTAFTAGSGYTLLNEVEDGTNYERIMNQSQISAHGSYSTNYTISNTAHWAVIGASFRPAGSGPAPTATPTPTPGSPTATPTPTPVVPQMIQGTDGTAATGSSATVPFSSNVTAGNLILVPITQHSGSVSSISDSQGDTFTAVSTAQHANASNDYTELYYAKNVHGGATSVTVNFSTTTKYVVGIYEYSGLDQTSPLDQVTGNTGNSTSPNGGTLTTTIDNELYFVVGVDDYTGNTGYTAGSGYTVLNEVDDGTNYERIVNESQISAHGSYSTNYTISNTAHWAVIGASFKPAGSSPAPTATPTPTPGGPTATPTPTTAPTATPTPTPTPATPTLVQGSDGTTTTASSGTVPFSSNVTAGDLILIAISHHSGSVTGVSDSQSDTFTSVATAQHANSSTDYTELYYAKNVHGGATSVTVNFSTSTKIDFGLYEYSGVNQTSPLDQVATGTGHSTSPNGGTLTTTQDNELYFVTGVDDYTGNTTPGAGSGYSILNTTDNGSSYERHYTENRVSAHGSYSSNFTISTSSHWAVIGASFKPQ